MDEKRIDIIKKNLYRDILQSGGKHILEQLLYIAVAAFLLILGAQLAFAAIKREIYKEEVTNLRERRKQDERRSENA